MFSRKKRQVGEQWNGSLQADERQLLLQEEVQTKETPDESLITDAHATSSLGSGSQTKLAAFALAEPKRQHAENLNTAKLLA